VKSKFDFTKFCITAYTHDQYVTKKHLSPKGLGYSVLLDMIGSIQGVMPFASNIKHSAE